MRLGGMMFGVIVPLPLNPAIMVENCILGSNEMSVLLC